MTKAIENPTDRCTAKTASSDYTVQCQRSPIKGGTVCRTHGGNMLNVRDAAAMRLSRQNAERQMRHRLKLAGEHATVQDALSEFEKVIAEVIIFKDICREQLDRVLANDEIRYEGKAGEQLRGEVSLYERAIERCAAVLSTGIKLGLAKRRQEIDEAQAVILTGVIKSILNRLELSGDQKVIAGRVVPEELRAISAKTIPGQVVR